MQTIGPAVYNQVMKPATAQEITQMMQKVVEEGTGQSAQLGGISVAGKTGTASIGATGSNLTQPWFIGFAPARHPKVAIAVTVAQTQGGFGATVAAPIAKDVLQTLLAEGTDDDDADGRHPARSRRPPLQDRSPGWAAAAWPTCSWPRTSSSGARWR